MTWRERRERASFRGVSFYVDGTTTTKARRVSVRKFAGRDGSEQQDHGRDPDEFDVVAFLAGPDYDHARDELEEALAEEGAGALVLPSRGDLWVRVTRGPITSESRDAGGYCSMRFTVVVEDRRAGSLRAAEDTRAALKGSAAQLRVAAGNDVRDSVRTQGQPALFLAKSAGAVRSFTAALRKVQTITQGLLSPVTALTAELGQLDSAANSVLSTPSQFVTSGIALVNTAFGIGHTVVVNFERTSNLPEVIASSFDTGRLARLADKALGAVRGIGSGLTQSAAPAAAQDQANADAVARFTLSASIAAQADIYADAEFDSASFALGALSRSLAAIDELVLLAPTDEHYAALASLRANLERHLVETASRLPETLRYTPPRATPALLLAWELYGDARKEADLVARNKPAHPLFLADPVEVLAP